MEMTQCLVTGAAGFIGSHLCEQLLTRNHRVIGIDSFIPYYPRKVKENNLVSLCKAHNFTFHEMDLRHKEINSLLKGVEVVFHLAAMPGFVHSWVDFKLYMTCNVEGTQRLLEASCKNRIKHFIHSSTSSVYGRIATGNEETTLEPCSPYGVTKLSAEHLCKAYAKNFDLPLTILRFFSVYGPRQRPDMAYHIFIKSLLQDENIIIYGDGEQSRSNTFIADCVQGTLLAFEKREQSIGEVFNLGGGEVVTINQVLAILAKQTGRMPRTTFVSARPGDQRYAAADISKARLILGYEPTTLIGKGLQAQLEWQRNMYSISRERIAERVLSHEFKN